ncbi:hypothetical protein [Chryseobacterium sp. MEBOG07]|uniref:hypothetical protein n=1 Tax=Chryseobacterium sp. MEBOG07 TaxID=2879939 RepID=UPI001F1B44DB|nr:hypothetical protein [Chryseobacterium sp. MEBOG07]UKB81538.1 hypothetical protein LF886_11270 [Chryseobacterium sp. MEBOG07]
MRTIFTLLICCFFLASCYQKEPEEPKTCKCKVQEYERVVLFKNEHDGSYTDYSDTGWIAKGDLQEDNAADCFRNETVKNQEFSSSYDSQYRREVSRKWVYNCK